MPTRRQAAVNLIDKAESISSVQFYIADADFITHNADSSAGPIRDLFTAVYDLSLAEDFSETLLNTNQSIAPAAPTDDQAYKSSKLIVFFTDNVTGDKYTVTVPARDPGAYNTFPLSKDVNLGAPAAGGTTQIQTFVTRFNLTARSKAGNAVTIQKISIAGRRQ